MIHSIVLMIVLGLVVGACTSSDSTIDVTQPATQDSGLSARQLTQPESDFCKAAQASLGRIALGELPATVEEARTFYEESWTSVSRTALTTQVRESANEVLNVRQTSEITAEVRAKLETAMLTVYQSVSEECPDLAVPVKIFLVRMLITAKVQINILTETWRSILEVKPLPELSPTPPDSSATTTTDPNSGTLVGGRDMSVYLCENNGNAEGCIGMQDIRNMQEAKRGHCPQGMTCDKDGNLIGG